MVASCAAAKTTPSTRGADCCELGVRTGDVGHGAADETCGLARLCATVRWLSSQARKRTRTAQCGHQTTGGQSAVLSVGMRGWWAAPAPAPPPDSVSSGLFEHALLLRLADSPRRRRHRQAVPPR